MNAEIICKTIENISNSYITYCYFTEFGRWVLAAILSFGFYKLFKIIK